MFWRVKRAGNTVLLDTPLQHTMDTPGTPRKPLSNYSDGRFLYNTAFHLCRKYVFSALNDTKTSPRSCITHWLGEYDRASAAPPPPVRLMLPGVISWLRVERAKNQRKDFCHAKSWCLAATDASCKSNAIATQITMKIYVWCTSMQESGEEFQAGHHFCHWHILAWSSCVSCPALLLYAILYFEVKYWFLSTIAGHDTCVVGGKTSNMVSCVCVKSGMIHTPHAYTSNDDEATTPTLLDALSPTRIQPSIDMCTCGGSLIMILPIENLWLHRCRQHIKNTINNNICNNGWLSVFASQDARQTRSLPGTY